MTSPSNDDAKPSLDEREWLLDALAALIEACGWERFVCAPLIYAHAPLFPDVARRGPAAVQVTARRLLEYAGFDGARAVVRDLREAAPARAAGELTATALRFSSVAGDAFEFELRELGDDDVPGILVHEVGYAFRMLRAGRLEMHPYRGGGGAKLDGGDEELSVRLGSLATVYLGFGAMAANAADSAQHGGANLGYLAVTSWHILRAGGLPSQALVYLLAVQAEVRGPEDPAYESLRANQREDFRRWRKALRGQRATLVERLGLPDPNDWPPPEPLPSPTPYDDEVCEGTRSERELTKYNRGRTVFRVRGNRAQEVRAAGILVGGVLGAVAWPVIGLYGFLAVMVAGALVGDRLGARRRADRCSEPNCGAPLLVAAIECPWCAGTIAGTIARASDRLAAAEGQRLLSD